MTIDGACQKKCVDWNGEFRCPSCGKLLVPICVNLGVFADNKLYCGRDFPDDCSKFGCPKYCYVYWSELKNYRNYGRFEPDKEEPEKRE